MGSSWKSRSGCTDEEWDRHRWRILEACLSVCTQPHQLLEQAGQWTREQAAVPAVPLDIKLKIRTTTPMALTAFSPTCASTWSLSTERNTASKRAAAQAGTPYLPGKKKYNKTDYHQHALERERHGPPYGI